MAKTTKRLNGNEQLSSEAGGWIVGQVPRPELEGDAANLLMQSAESRPGNVRFAVDVGKMYFVGELRDPDGRLTLPAARERLFAATSGPVEEVSKIETTCVLGETPYEWSQSPGDPNQWQAVANDPRGCRCDLTATIVPRGVEVRSQPVVWQAVLAEASESATFRFLAAAHGRIRFARFAVQDRKLSAVSFAAADRLDIELPDSVAAAVAACQLVWREVAALANTTVSQAYLETMI